VPDARISFILRDPIAHALSSYKYFCLQERNAQCTDQELTERIMQSIVFLRYVACNGTLGSRSNASHRKCKDFNELPVIVNPSPTKRWNVTLDDVADVWPANDVHVMRDWWRYWGSYELTDHVHRGAIMEGIYWPRLLQWRSAWPEENLLCLFSDDLSEDAAATVRSALQFYGAAIDDLHVNTEAKLAHNIASLTNRRSNNVTLSSDALRMLQDIFIPHLHEHARLINAFIKNEQLVAIPPYIGTSHLDWLPDVARFKKQSN
jgi:hypothetical protein